MPDSNVLLAALHRYTPREVAENFCEAKISPHCEPGTGIYFVEAFSALKILDKQDRELQHLRRKISRLQSAHDKLFAQLKKLIKTREKQQALQDVLDRESL